MNPPSTTFCMTSRSKSTILDGYKLSHGVVNEPNSKDQNILINLDKMVETLFREITYKLIFICTSICGFTRINLDGKMKDSSDNYIEVQIKPRLTSNQTPIDTTLIHIQFFKWFPFSVYLIVFLSGMICDVETKNMSSGLYTFTTEFQENSNHSCEVLTLIH